MYPNTNVEIYVYSFGVVLLVGLGLLFANKTHCMPTSPIRYFVK